MSKIWFSGFGPEEGLGTAYDADQIGRLEANVAAALAPGCKVFDDAHRVLHVLRPALHASVCKS